jgi:cytoskeleton protein RodZ
MTDKTGVGQELAAAREERGLALSDVAQQLKFAPRQLEALEQENFAALPGATFARGMVRSYARLLKLDPEPLVQRVSGHFEIPDSNRLAARYHQPVPFSDNARRSTFVYLAMSLGVLVLVGGIAYEWHQERTAAAKKSTTLAKAQKSTRSSEPRVVAVAPAAAPASASAPARPMSPEKVTDKPKLAEKIKIAEQPKPAEQPKVAEAPAAAVSTGPKSGPNRLVVRTDGEAWIEIRDAADRMLVSSLNPPGSERVVRGRPPYTLVIGNASNVRVTYDDKPVDLAPHTRQDVARLTVP